jgi:hypothetical protein
MVEAHGRTASLVRRVVAFAGGACLLALGAMAVLLLASDDAHAATLGPMDVPVELPVQGPAPVQPLEDTVSPVVQPAVDAISPTTTRIIKPAVDTISPTIEPAVDTLTPIVTPIVQPAPLPLVPPLPPVFSMPATDVTNLSVPDIGPGAPPSTVHGVTSLAAPMASSSEVRVPPLPHVPGNGSVRARGLGSATSTSGAAPAGSPHPLPPPAVPTVLSQPPTNSSSSSLDAGRGLQLLLFAIAATLTALYLTRGRRVLPFGAVAPRYAFVSLIERPG